MTCKKYKEPIKYSQTYRHQKYKARVKRGPQEPLSTTETEIYERRRQHQGVIIRQMGSKQTKPTVLALVPDLESSQTTQFNQSMIYKVRVLYNLTNRATLFFYFWTKLFFRFLISHSKHDAKPIDGLRRKMIIPVFQYSTALFA